jgi:FkbM family methyltransferase
MEWFLSHIQTGSIVWDIGANIGMWTTFVAKHVGPAGRVVAFEPFSEAFQLLIANLELNGVTNVVSRAEALGARDGRILLYPARAGVLSTSSFARIEGRYGTEDEPIDVRLMSGASVAREIPSLLPDAVKIDVEGAEQAVLEGFSEPIWRKLKILAIEVHPDFLPSLGGSAEEVKRLIHSQNIQVAVESSRRNTLHWLCVRDAR